VLLCVAMCCRVLQCGAVCRNIIQCVAVCCHVLQCGAVCCNVMPCVAMCCSVLQFSAQGCEQVRKFHAGRRTKVALVKSLDSSEFSSEFSDLKTFASNVKVNQVIS